MEHEGIDYVQYIIDSFARIDLDQHRGHGMILDGILCTTVLVFTSCHLGTLSS